jgi:uncharacterized protein YbjT (DUF2867 family)
MTAHLMHASSTTILITGATGFIGGHLLRALTAAGYTVIAAQRRRAPEGRTIFADFARDHDPARWIPRLQGVDIVINAVGVIGERGEQRFSALHTLGPQALFSACASARVRRVIQISALGAASAATPYFASKHAADDFLSSLPLEWTIVQPSLVFGAEGASARLFLTLASLPLVPVPGRGEQRIQPIHIDDLCAAVLAMIERDAGIRERLACVGPTILTLRDYLSVLRRSLMIPPAPIIHIPMRCMQAAAWLCERMRMGLLNGDALRMLAAGNVADQQTHRWLADPMPRPPEQFIPPAHARSILLETSLRWLLPILRISLALVWLWSGITSLGLYPRATSYEMLAASGIPTALQPTFLFGAAALDLLLGVATLALRRRRWLWRIQFGLIVAYTAILSWSLPTLWLHPFGPILKNLPMLALIALLYRLEPLLASRPWNT